MIKRTSIGLLLLALSTSSCVSKKIYTDLENKFAELKKERNALADENELLKSGKSQANLDLAKVKSELEKIKAERDKLAADYSATSNNLATLQNSYNALEKNSDDALKANMDKNRELLAQLEAKEKALAAEKARLDKLSKEFKDRSDRVTELENLVAAKEASMKKLRETLAKSLKAFEGKGLVIHQKDGKVYVSMENKLLFESGSWTVGTDGKKAVDLVSKVLADNPDISILIEGHTDNDKITGTLGGGVENNWDLSTKRATAIVNLLSANPKIKKENLTAAGRSEYSPLVSNESTEGKAKNRRIEIILTPKLDELTKALDEL
ncbi:cell envelope biogenesis protein OmpA [Flavobacterium columnare NBRC 100251 = ATCC 23463]|uniref:Flagellar motor/chemotaxis (MotB)-related protein n=2 Tax=Flavobacterium columnare TaxID=996 RepID=G8XBQ3_FLACA|nr:OmpA family protein [Flavobacterium columnare]AEW87468.1 flagellar motor/chemotaxis (MotB)-related protein [Flavobacterium columnare ATCC 49512]AMO20233.1 cell envelope biogenesis protein OmpA [Flavobacterium columnare]ANO49457.1 flagellar motor/chemotaxis (MotB)-related protein [Flavobacterium columnare]APT22581.1 cell envelope biogenesis protein OmpA [Flavobacterium columnare]AUX18187.1 cell envelope biogenesis protein OmpA [Flavobacterium columnare]